MKILVTKKLRTEEVIEAYGSQAEIARLLGISKQAVSSWGEYVPELRAYQLREMAPDIFGQVKAA